MRGLLLRGRGGEGRERRQGKGGEEGRKGRGGEVKGREGKDGERKDLPWFEKKSGYSPAALRWFTCPKTVAHPSTNRAQCKATLLITTNA